MSARNVRVKDPTKGLNITMQHNESFDDPSPESTIDRAVRLSAEKQDLYNMMHFMVSAGEMSPIKYLKIKRLLEVSNDKNGENKKLAIGIIHAEYTRVERKVMSTTPTLDDEL
jgi:hypothetical protein